MSVFSACASLQNPGGGGYRSRVGSPCRLRLIVKRYSSESRSHRCYLTAKSAVSVPVKPTSYPRTQCTHAFASVTVPSSLSLEWSWHPVHFCRAVSHFAATMRSQPSEMTKPRPVLEWVPCCWPLTINHPHQGLCSWTQSFNTVNRKVVGGSISQLIDAIPLLLLWSQEAFFSV